MATYTKQHISPWRRGWRYKRRVPRAYVPLLGYEMWDKYLGAISQPDAVMAARKLDVENDELIAKLRAMPEAERTELARRGGLQMIATEADHLERRYSAVEDESTIDLDAPDAIQRLKAVRAARHVNGRVEYRRRLLGVAIERVPRLDALVPVWERVSSPRNNKTVGRMHRYVGRFVGCVGDLAPDAFDRSHIIKFRDALEAEGKSRSNVQAHLHALHRLFAVAVSEGLISANPASGVKVAKPAGARFADERKKKPFTGAQVSAILTASAASLSDDLQLIIRLLAFHGARSGEIVQLRPSDVTSIAGVPILRITDEVGTLKNKFSRREVPIHPSCMDVVKRAEALADEPWLFMSLRRSKDKGTRFQRIASRFLRDVVGIADAGLTMHSLRHTWRTVAREIDMPEPVSRAIMGHAMGRDDHAGYGGLPSLTKRAEWMAKVDPTLA